MKWLFSAVTLGLLWALPVVAPLHAADREHQQMMADIRMLQEQTGRLNQMLGALEQTLQTLLVRLDDQNEDRRRAFADQRLMVDNVAGGVRIVRRKWTKRMCVCPRSPKKSRRSGWPFLRWEWP